MDNNSLGGFVPSASPEFSRWQLDAEDYISQIYNILAGVVYKQGVDGKIISVIAPEQAQLNDLGIRIVIDLLKFTLHKGMVLSDFDPKEISKLTQAFHKKLARELIVNWKDFGAKSPTLASDIAFKVASNVFAALKRAKGGNTFDRMSKSHIVSENVQKKTTGGQGGFTNVLGGFKQ